MIVALPQENLVVCEKIPPQLCQSAQNGLQMLMNQHTILWLR